MENKLTESDIFDLQLEEILNGEIPSTSYLKVITYNGISNIVPSCSRIRKRYGIPVSCCSYCTFTQNGEIPKSIEDITAESTEKVSNDQIMILCSHCPHITGLYNFSMRDLKKIWDAKEVLKFYGLMK